MSEQLNTDLAERRAYPFAVGARVAGESRLTYTHFATMEAAAMTAHLLDTEGNIVTRWVALTEPEYVRTAVTPGWRQVTYFNTEICTLNER